MRQMMLFLLAVSVCPRIALAQEAPDADDRRDRAILTVGRVNYWGTTQAAPKPKEPGATVESVWVEPIRTPDGRYAPYVPPPQVLQFLENPTPETARSYLRWQSERIAKLRRAMELLDTVGKTEQAEPKPREAKSDKPPVAEPRVSRSAGGVELLYFKQGNCPYCNLQDEVLAQLRASHAQVKVREVAKGTAPELWRKYGVTVTPTIVVLDGDNARDTLHGLMSLNQIVAAIQKGTVDEK